MDDRDALVKELIRLARDAEEPQVLLADSLRDQATAAFDSLEEALAAALMESAAPRGRRPQKSEVERRLTEAFEHPLYVATADGKYFSLDGPVLETGPSPYTVDDDDEVDPITAVHYVGDSDDVVLFTTTGRYFGLDRRMIPTWDRRDQPRTIRDILFLEAQESVCAILPRRKVAVGRVIHVTREGKGKASDASEFGSGLDRSGLDAFLVRDGDLPIAVLGGPTENTLFCASRQGQGIHFDADDMRSMGRKAVGVNVMKLQGDDDAVVSAFLGRHVRQVAVITELGFGKRLDFSEFRTQGRGGQGMQVIRLNPGDGVAGVCPCNPAEDLGVTTDQGRVFRIPATDLNLMGRPARGDQVIELRAQERILHLSALPCGSAPEAS